VTVWRGEKWFKQSFSRGAAVAPMSEGMQGDGTEEEDASQGGGGKGGFKKGTRVRFKPDALIFKEKQEFVPKIILNRMKELAFLNSTATFRFRTPAVKVKAGKKKAMTAEEEEDAAEVAESKAGKAAAAAAAAVAAAAEAAAAAESVVTVNGVDYNEQILNYPGGLKDYVLDLNSVGLYKLNSVEKIA
jgi:DNA gyrase/topoisomerase IV subunit B